MQPAIPSPPTPRSVLVVDDDAGVRDVCSALLDALGFQSRGACSGLEALEALEGTDVVLLDMNMPAMDGGQVFEAMRRVRPDLKVVVMSGRPREDLQQWLQIGASGVLRKPFGLGDLDQSLMALHS